MPKFLIESFKYHIFRLYDYDKTFSTVEIALASLPTERYKRNVIRGKLDLVGKFYNSFSGYLGRALFKTFRIREILFLSNSVSESHKFFKIH